MFKAIRRIIAWTGPYKRNLYLGCVCSFLMTWATAAPVMLAAWMLAQVQDDARGIAALDPRWVWLSLVAILACILVRFAFSYGKNRLQESIGYEVAPEERVRIGTILKRVPLGYFSTVKTGDILATATTELGMLELQGMKMVDAVVNGYLSVAAIVVFLAFMYWPCAVAAVAGVALSGLALAGINRRSRALTPATHVATEHLAGSIVEYARGLGTAKSYGRGTSALEPMYAACAEAKQARLDVEYGFTPFNVLHLIALNLASVALVGCAAWACLHGELSLWMFLAIALFSFTLFGSVERVNDSAHMLGDLNDVLDRLEAIERAPFIDEDGRDVALERFDVEFEDVAFSYGEGAEARRVLHDVSFRIPQGSTCAIVGPSGAGKTTVANLMARFYDVDEGRVRVGGHDVRELTCDSLLRAISMVFQNVYLFNDTVRANIAFGRPGATDEDVVEAARRAQCHDFIEALPQGYDTVVGEGGSSLSGGQKQRISIARALLKDAPLVILDEATASVDPENEALIQQAIGELTAGKTVVVIAHRLATIEAADQILVVDGGTVAQRGTHDELMAEGGTYRRFVELRAAAEGWRIGERVALR
ncbi:ABC transporter ATP-binding protein [Eggerthella sinensis]|uniref:ABC transporter ATP-binding protein n=1 Tax=Eggerthella sinensis TaxID=242230 RepID=UPI00248DAFCA|nr:ABC transporter ATP-binding protein [Eggerthella sinensis]